MKSKIHSPLLEKSCTGKALQAYDLADLVIIVQILRANLEASIKNRLLILLILLDISTMNNIAECKGEGAIKLNFGHIF